MKKLASLPVSVGLVLAVVWASGLIPLGAVDVPVMTKEELRPMLENKDLLILDVRKGKDWSASEFKIKGAVRVDPRKVDSWADRHGKRS